MERDCAAGGGMTDQPNYITINRFPPGVAVVGLTTFKDRLFVATSNGVYEMVGEELVPVPFKEIPAEERAQGPVDIGGHHPSCEAAQMHLNPEPHKLYICSCGRV